MATLAMGYPAMGNLAMVHLGIPVTPRALKVAPPPKILAPVAHNNKQIKNSSVHH